ncbi:hypothetical protein KO507_06885 [Gilvimarinus agarilyticus]|uniref:hypothetical protein n=1 Tax=unclassified Gilvimarinus TaxID=2642066 RepID=UPI001C08A57C|nr:MULTISPECIES: hypothetical protein [unclassified Gilvimarinus]MBU2885482.1 hypothetical protein [Gilvimarinus agarilyticus]MDO6570382.1 hypothetical protein [Gilvimarinus sp. 2_MG-2023]MDO6748444.1 hypothetical protein [Gilvimarinus sp. 1_MG-2023]
MKTLSVLTVSLLMSLGVMSAVADETERQGATTSSAFTMADKNRDGSIDEREAQASGVSGDRFDTLDENGDGKLSASEYRKAGGGQSNSWQ